MFSKHYIVVDDFYPDPYAVRELAFDLDRQEPGAGKWPGVMTKEPWWTPQHSTILYNITGDNLKLSRGVSGHFRFTQQNDAYSQLIHFDPNTDQIWAGVVHLSLQTDIDQHERPDYKCGTSFWRHKRTGLESIPLTQSGIESYGWYNTKDLQVFLETDGLDTSLWDETFYIPPRFNRLTLFRPWLFHSAGKAFGNTLQNSRVIHTLFLSLDRNV